MQLNEYQERAHETLNEDEQVLTNLALGLGQETGAVLALIQAYAFENKEITKEEMTKELGDVLWYISQLACWMDVSFEDIAEANLAHIQQKYLS